MRVPFGYCHCGCGQKTNLSKETRTRDGSKRGFPRRFLHAHQLKLKEIMEKAAKASAITIRSQRLREIQRINHLGNKNGMWKGDSASVSSGRERATRLFKEIGNCEICDKKAMERHHKDRNVFNNKRENLQFLCRSCQMKVDKRMNNLAQYRRLK